MTGTAQQHHHRGLSAMDDETLIRRFAEDQDDPEAAKALLHGFSARVRAVMAAQHLFLIEDAMAYAADVWLKLRMSAPSFNGYGQSGAARGWINSIIFSTVVDRVRKDRPMLSQKVSSEDKVSGRAEKSERIPRRQYLSEEDWERHASTRGYQDPAPGFSTHKEHETAALYRGIQAMGKQHPKKARLLLLRLNDMPFEQISKRLDASPAALRQSYISATKLLTPYVKVEIDSRFDAANEPSNFGLENGMD